MNKKMLIKMLINHYFIIYTSTMAVTLAVCTAQHIYEFEIARLWELALFSLGADLPLIAYYSKNELSKKQYIFRTAVHTVLLEAVLMFYGCKLGLYSGAAGGVLFFFVVLGVDLFVRLITYLNDLKTASDINEKLNQKR